MMDRKTESMLEKSKSAMGFNVYYHTAPLKKKQSLFCVLKCVNIFKKKNQLAREPIQSVFFLSLTISICLCKNFVEKNEKQILSFRS